MASGSDHSGHLKLTLRTLLAWLDDALPPEEARNIGQRVSESSVARDLIARIKKVTRRRRLTVPPGTGPDATDPNFVAAYLDNQLPAEQVAEYEERCLKSELHLSEAASCHQILSMLGQKAKVPGEARFRMYRLIKGREANSLEPTASSQSLPEPEPAAAPIPRWLASEAQAEEGGWKRYWPLAAIAGLLLCLLGTSVLLAPPRSAFRTSPAADASAPAVVLRPPVVIPPRPAPVEAETAKPEEAVADAVAETKAEPAPAADAVDVAEAGQTSGRFVVAEREGLLLRRDSETGDWSLAPPGTTLQAGDDILGLAPYRTALKLGDAEVELVGPTRLRLLDAPPPSAPILALEIGRLVVQGGTSLKPIAVALGEQTVQITPPIGGPAGVARIDQRAPGSPAPGPSFLEFYSARDSVQLTTPESEARISGSSSVKLLPEGTFDKPATSAPPVWVLAQRPSEVDILLGRDFSALFPEDARVNRSLAEALESDQPEVRDLAVTALAAMGKIDLILPVLTREDEDSAIRNRVITVLRSFDARDEAASRSLRAQLEIYGGEAWAAIVQKLLAGFSAEAAAKQETYTELVRLLEHRDIGVRTLALEQLTRLTGRDRLEYDPTRPTEGRGLEAWKKLLRDGDLKPAATVAPTVEPREPTETPETPAP